MSATGTPAPTRRGIFCGHCHGRHATVVDVRDCSRGGPHAAQVIEPAPARTLGSFGGRLNEAAQRAELRNLESDVPAGRYAVRGVDERVRFYLVQCPADGRWAGYTFLSQVTGHVGEGGIRIKHPAARLDVLHAIVDAGLAESSRLYGREIGSCGVCGRVLTDEASRAAGIGPVCSANTGW